MTIISPEQIKVYDNFKGDMDAFARMGSKSEKLLFLGTDENKIWQSIDSAMQDIDLISKGLSSPEFTLNTMSKLRSITNSKAFTILRERISFFEDFKELTAILETIRSRVADNDDLLWNYFKTIDELKADIDNKIENLQLCNYAIIHTIYLEFSPTGTYQELSIQNGWTQEYLQIAENFDAIYNRIIHKRESINNQFKGNISSNEIMSKQHFSMNLINQMKQILKIK